MRKIRHFGVLPDGTVIRWNREAIKRKWPTRATGRIALLGPNILDQITVVLAFSAGEARLKVNGEDVSRHGGPRNAMERGWQMTYRTFKRSATNWREFSTGKKTTVDSGLTHEEAFRQCEEFNRDRSQAELSNGTKLEFESE